VSSGQIQDSGELVGSPFATLVRVFLRVLLSCMARRRSAYRRRMFSQTNRLSPQLGLRRFDSLSLPPPLESYLSPPLSSVELAILRCLFTTQACLPGCHRYSFIPSGKRRPRDLFPALSGAVPRPRKRRLLFVLGAHVLVSPQLRYFYSLQGRELL